MTHATACVASHPTLPACGLPACGSVRVRRLATHGEAGRLASPLTRVLLPASRAVTHAKCGWLSVGVLLA
jgi:hypothetical protein